MADYVKLAHDNTHSGDWSGIHKSKLAADEIRAAIEDFVLSESDAESIIRAYSEATWPVNLEGRTPQEPEVDTPPEQDHNQPMTDTTDYRHELSLRDEQLRRDMTAHRELADERMKGLDDRVKAFMDNQVERDKRIEDIAVRATKAAESAATVKSNYWAAVGVQLLAVAAILVGAYFATQANTLSAISTTLSAYQAGKAEPASQPAVQPPATAPPQTVPRK